MRIYDSATIKEELLTGFQSPCSEFAEKPISFDERYGLGNPALKLLTVDVDFPHLGVFKKDQLLVDLSKKPSPADLVVTFFDDEIRLFQGNRIIGPHAIFCGVVKVIIRNVYKRRGEGHEFES